MVLPNGHHTHTCCAKQGPCMQDSQAKCSSSVTCRLITPIKARYIPMQHPDPTCVSSTSSPLDPPAICGSPTVYLTTLCTCTPPPYSIRSAGCRSHIHTPFQHHPLGKFFSAFSASLCALFSVFDLTGQSSAFVSHSRAKSLHFRAA